MQSPRKRTSRFEVSNHLPLTRARRRTSRHGRRESSSYRSISKKASQRRRRAYPQKVSWMNTCAISRRNPSVSKNSNFPSMATQLNSTRRIRRRNSQFWSLNTTPQRYMYRLGHQRSVQRIWESFTQSHWRWKKALFCWYSSRKRSIEILGTQSSSNCKAILTLSTSTS